MIFVFAGGASGSGKTGLSQRLLTKLNLSGTSCQILKMDDYFHERPENEDPEAFRQNTNFDTPDMLHLDLLRDHLIALNQGQSITKPIFVFQSNRREGEQTVVPSDVMIIEGIFGQYFAKEYLPPELNTLMINIATESYFDILTRRIRRDVEERHRDPLSVIQQEKKFVGPGFLKYTASSTVGSDIYILNKHARKADEQNILDASADEVICKLENKKASIVAGEPSIRSQSPIVQEIIASSHLTTGKFFKPHELAVDSQSNPNQFNGTFSGVFGKFRGTFIKQANESEATTCISMVNHSVAP